MSKTKKIFLLHERRETWRFKFGKTRRGFCDKCQEATIWLTSSEAAQFSDLSERVIFSLAENAAIHFTELDSGILLICEHSLEVFAQTRNSKKRKHANF